MVPVYNLLGATIEFSNNFFLVDVFTYLAPPPPPPSPLPDDPMLSVSFEEEASGQLPERPLLLRCFLELLLEGLEDVCQAVDSSPHSSESYSESEGPPSESDIWNRQGASLGAMH